MPGKFLKKYSIMPGKDTAPVPEKNLLRILSAEVNESGASPGLEARLPASGGGLDHALYF